MNYEDNWGDLKTYRFKNRIENSEYGKLLTDVKEISFVHIGFDRTGTTFLQKEVLPLYPESKHVFSDEKICGIRFNSGFEHAETVYHCFPNARIIIVLRNQYSIINSVYRTYIKTGGIWRFSKFVDSVNKSGKYDYYAVVQRYFEFFGKENCIILLYEDFVDNADVFISTFLSFIGVKKPFFKKIRKVNIGPSKYLNEFIRIYNCISYLWFCFLFNTTNKQCVDQFMNRSRKARNYIIRWGSTVDNKIIKRLSHAANSSKQFHFNRTKDLIIKKYSVNNIKLERLTELDLSRYGYY